MMLTQVIGAVRPQAMSLQGLTFLAAGGLCAVWLGPVPLLVLIGVLVVVARAAPRARPAPHVAQPDTPDPAAQAGVYLAQGCPVICASVALDGAPSARRRQACLAHLRKALRPSDFAALAGEDGIVLILCPDTRLARHQLAQLATRLQQQLEDPFPSDGRLVHVSAAIGLAASWQMPTPPAPADLVGLAHHWRDAAREQGRSAIRIAPDASGPIPPAPQQLHLAAAALRALDHGQITGWFQPRLCTETGLIGGVEVLARWSDPGQGLVPPARFLPALMSQGCLTRLTDAMAGQSAAALADWDKRGVTVATVSLNVCDDDLSDPALCDRLTAAVTRHRIAPNRLRLDITAAQARALPTPVLARLVTRLADCGIGLDIDCGPDLSGTGVLLRAKGPGVPARVVLSRHLVARLDRDEAQRARANTVLAAAERMGLQTVATGVETLGEHAVLAQLGCTFVQGFGVARPMAAQALPTWMRAQETRMKALPQLTRPAAR